MPTPSSENPIAIVVAVAEEFNALKKKMPTAEMSSDWRFPVAKGLLGGKTVLLYKSGMGRGRCNRAVYQLAENYNPSCFIIAGFSGSLCADVGVGDIVIVDSVEPQLDGSSRESLIPKDEEGLTYRRYSSKSMLPSTQLKSGFRVHSGALITSENVIRFARDKQELGKTTGAIAVDMETIGGAAMAAFERKPWIGIRAISDGLMTDLPLDFSKVVWGGEVDRWSLGWYVLTHPFKIPSLITLGKHSALAARNLSDYVEQYVDGLSLVSGQTD